MASSSYNVIFFALLQGFMDVALASNDFLAKTHESASKYTGSRSPSASNCSLQNVLIIIDMQNDYDIAENMKLYGYAKNPYVGNLSEAAGHIVDLIYAPVQWDLIVFSMDWLIPAICEVYGFNSTQYFCQENTPGVWPLDKLKAAANDVQPRQVYYAKNRDDVFTEMIPDEDLVNSSFPIPDYYPNRGYDVDNNNGGLPLKDVLAQQGFTVDNTKLTIVGTVVDMCVLTSTVHATTLGYSVDVYEPGLNGDGAIQDWCLPLPNSGEPMPADWQEILYTCQGSAGREAALQYMEMSGATVLEELPRC